MTRYLYVLTLAILSALFSCKSPNHEINIQSDTVLEAKFEQMTNKVWSKKSKLIFRLDTLTNYSWDSVIILTPYYPIYKIEQKTKIDFTAVRHTAIVNDEVSNVLAFIKNGQLINYVDLPRNKGDFLRFQDSINIFTKDNCLFEFEEPSKLSAGMPLLKVKHTK